MQKCNGAHSGQIMQGSRMLASGGEVFQIDYFVLAGHVLPPKIYSLSTS